MVLLPLLSTRLSVEGRYLKFVAKSADHHYKTYTIEGRGGVPRLVHHPSKPLKAIQRCLSKYVVALLPVHEAAMAYRVGVGIAANAALHAASRYLLRMDFREFFPSLTDEDLRLHFAANVGRLPGGWDEGDTELMIQFVCRLRRLTIGAPTSPALANTLMHRFDNEVTRLSAENQVVYSRYADDLYFSTLEPRRLSTVENAVAAILRDIPYPKRLEVNESKTRHLSKRRRRLVTGVVLASQGGISLGRSTKRRLRSLVYRWEELDDDTRRSLAGHLAHARSIEPDFINRLILKFGIERVHRAQHGATAR
jgi:RNA-directed DNA polymerase